jgi:hypothetical protein
VGRGLEDRTRAGAKTRAGVGCQLGLAVSSFNEASLAAFPGRRGLGFLGLLLGLAFLEASNLVGFLLLVGAELVGGAILGVPVPEAEGIMMARGQVTLEEPGLGARDWVKIVSWRGLGVLVQAEAGLQAWLVSLASVCASVGVDFLGELVVGGSGQVLGGGGRGVAGFFFIGFPVRPEALAGAEWGVGGTSFRVGGFDFVDEGGAVFWVGWGLLAGAIEEGSAGLVGRRLGILVAAIFCDGWTITGRGIWVEPGREAEDREGGAFLADSLAGGSGDWAAPPPVLCWGGFAGLVLRVLVGIVGATVAMGTLLAGRAPRAGVDKVRFSRPSRAKSGWKVKGLPESQGRRAPSWGRYMSAPCLHCCLRCTQ